MFFTAMGNIFNHQSFAQTCDIENMQVGTKGNKAGVEEDAYRLPTGIFNFQSAEFKFLFLLQRTCCPMRGTTGIASTAMVRIEA